MKIFLKLIVIVLAIIFLGSCGSNKKTYTVKFYDDFDNLYNEQTLEVNQKIELPSNPSKEGYFFEGWNEEVPNKMPNKDLVFKAVFSKVTYKITFNDGFGEVVFEANLGAGETILLPDEPTKEQYLFTGWNEEVPNKMPKANLVFTAQWEKVIFSVTFNDGSKTIFHKVIGEKGTAIINPGEPIKAGYFFMGWDKEIPLVIPDEDLIINAIWEENRSINEQVNAIYYVLELFYYQDLEIDLREIEEVYQLYEYLDPYTYLYEAASLGIDRDENYVGLGVTVNHLAEGLLVNEINLFSPIDEYLYVGDIIVSVDGHDLSLVDFEKRIPLILGEVGTIRTIGVMRFGEYVEFDYALKEINNESIYYELFDDVGYIYINRFGADTHNRFRSALNILEDSEIKELVIDVRNDGGGYLSAVVDILEHFIVDSNPFLIIQDIKENRETKYTPIINVKKPYGITVLVNGRSASASEVLAEALKQEGYEVFGTQTYGKDVYQGGVSMGRAFGDLFEENIILNITLGYWLPHNRIRVSEGVIPTEVHEQTGLYNYVYPYLLEEYSLGDEGSIIEVFQYLISKKTSFINISSEFTIEFKEALEVYQEDHGLVIDGKLNLETQMLLIDYYRTLIKDKSNDEQLAYLINQLQK